ncbi:MAG: hypothetical protein NXI04_10200 [Planctomycetaceae bacterium]|nr:hypothetical protein [Planctomycetaceae bacterium]
MRNTLPNLILLTSLLAVGLATVCPRARADDWAADYEGELALPSVTRYDRLPTRLLMLDVFDRVSNPEFMPDTFLNFFVRVLDGDYDNELHWEAADALHRVAREQLAEPDRILPSLRNRLQHTDSMLVKRVCAQALVAADDRSSAEALSQLCGPDEHVLSTIIEPWLAEVRPGLLQERWLARLENPGGTSQPQVLLACRCLMLAKCDPARGVLQELVESDQVRFVVRQAAAGSLSRLHPPTATDSADRLAAGPVTDRILAAMLLDQAPSERGLALLSTLCDDADMAVAALAWSALERLDRRRLADRLPSASRHPEPSVRRAVVRALRHLASTDHCRLLLAMLADRHIGVRNDARAALHAVAEESDTLRPDIVTGAGGILQSGQANWEQLEQAMLLLGQQRHGEFQSSVVPLLTYERHEVFVTAAWLLHLMPRPELSDEVVRVARQRMEYLNSGQYGPSLRIKDANSIQLRYLFHVAASTGRADIAPIARQMLNKEAPTLVETRAVGVWALGVVSRGEPTAESVRRSLVARVHDDSEEVPEDILVKSTAALGLGEMLMKESIPDLERAHSKYGIGGELGLSVSRSLRMLGEDPPEPPPLQPLAIGGWKLGPSFRDQ